jgi:glycyl-tRNA synthetase beta chain
MPQLLLELFSEEIPARMQAQAARDLERLARDHLGKAELAVGEVRAFAGPRRLTLVIEDLPPAQSDRTEDRKGPRTNAPEKALEGFLRATGLAIEQLDVRDGVYFGRLHRPGRPTPVIVAEMVEAIVRAFPWPKSMRWGAGTLRWVRPLKRILCVFDGALIPFAIEGIASSDVTQGHRFLGQDPAPFAVAGFDDYAAKLRAHFVLLDPAERRRVIQERARAACAARGLELVEDEGLLEEICGLAEWPVPILGDMDARFLDLPAEVIRTSMRVHQRYFAVRDPATGKLAPHFLVVANIEPKDGGAVIAHGNARVLTARLSDARFFWTQDQRPGAIETWLKKLEGVTFHAKLGAMAKRVERIAALAEEIAPLVGADPKLAAIAARLAKADLASGMVGEFPELQGVMGGYYVRAIAPSLFTEEVRGGVTASASADCADTTPAPTRPREGGGGALLAGLTREEIAAVADAVRDHYKPLGPSDTVPTAPLTVAVALADKLDTLVGFFAIDERPTGSRDPFGLRRAALGAVRLLVGAGARLSLNKCLEFAVKNVDRDVGIDLAPIEDEEFSIRDIGSNAQIFKIIGVKPENTTKDVLDFFADRLKVLLRDEGKRHDLVDAVFALGDDDLVRIVRRVEALDAFLQTADGASLLAGYKRASNILRIEEKKDGLSYAGVPEPLPGSAPEEAALIAAIAATIPAIDAALAQEDYTGAMIALSKLRAPLDAFFEKVFVNDPEPSVRRNRLLLLSQIRAAADRVADFSRIAGQ